MIGPGGSRLPDGGRIERSVELRFEWNGRSYAGHPGDTLASALLASGVRVVSRSLKLHRPRGIVAAGVEEPNAIFQLAGDADEPHVRATTTRLREGMVARSVVGWPGVGFDVGAALGWLSPLMPAGFYYKTFMWPGSGWNLYGPLIRRFAGYGRAPRSVDTGHYEKRHHHCEVLVVGAGPAGLAAALAAARSGARVLLVDERSEPGGALLDQPASVDDAPALEWVARAVAELDASPRVRRLRDATAFGFYDHGLLGVVEREPRQGWIRERFWRVRAGRVVLATGALERPLLFPDNDRPGVMLASAVLAYQHRFAVNPGRRAVVATNNSSAYQAAIALARGGLPVSAIVDLRSTPPPDLCRSVQALGIEVLAGHAVLGVHGRRGVRAVTVGPTAGTGAVQRIECDLVLSAGGWNPVVHLHSQSGARPVFDPARACFVPGQSVQAESSAGAARGRWDLGECLADGFEAGARAVGRDAGWASGDWTPVCSASDPLTIEPDWRASRSSPRRKTFVDLQNDVTVADIELAHRENFASVEHVKRYTTAGMGTDQGKLGNVSVIGVLAGIEGCDPQAVGTTTYRPPYTPVSFAAIAGNDRNALVLASRRTAITDWNEAAGAKMFEAGSAYRRPSYYPRAGEDADTAIAREALAARNQVGIYDGSPLGKFELRGPDVVPFLNLAFINAYDSLQVGRGRYGWMLHEDGRLLGDGVTFRTGPDRYLLYTGSGDARDVHLHLEHLLQVEFPGLSVFVTVVTAQWTNLCVCGPRAREVLQAAGVDISLDRESLPFLGIRECHVAGLDARVARVSYTGELSFEVNVRARDGLVAWRALLEAGAPFGITPIGSEASGVLRVEKGFVVVGAEGDGIVNPYDAGFGAMVKADKADFVGKRMLHRDLNSGVPRPQVVGLLADDSRFVAAAGTPILDGVDANGIPAVVGHVTQAVYSPNLGRSVALALVEGGRERHGDTVTIAAIDGRRPACIAPPCFMDPDGSRMRS